MFSMFYKRIQTNAPSNVENMEEGVIGYFYES